MCSEFRTVQDYIDAGVLEIGDGYRAKNTELGKKGLPFARAGNIDGGFNFKDADRYPAENIGRLGSKVSLAGDSLFTSKGTVGRIAYVTEQTPQFVYSPQLCYWRSRDPAAIDSRFLNVWMRGSEFSVQVAYLKGQTDMADYVSLRDQRRMSVTLPPITEQRKIADVIFALDEKIAVNQQLSATLEEISRTVFQSWFIDFLPVRVKATARAEGRDPIRAAMCALSGKDEVALDFIPREQYEQLAATAALFPDEVVNSNLGEVPIGWKIDSLVNHLEVERGLSYQGSGLAEAGLPLHNLNSINEGGGYKFDGIKFYSGKYGDRHILEPGDVIVANTEQGHKHLLIGYAAVVPNSYGESGLFSQHLYRVRPKQGSDLRSGFITYLLNSHRMHCAVSGYANGTTVNMLPDSALKYPKFAVPSSRLIQIFERFAKDSLRSRELRIAESHTLAELRDTLLPKMLSGEIRVGEAQELVEAAA